MNTLTQPHCIDDYEVYLDTSAQEPLYQGEVVWHFLILWAKGLGQLETEGLVLPEVSMMTLLLFLPYLQN